MKVILRVIYMKEMVNFIFKKELLDKLIETVTDISSISERDMFINGFRLGMKLMIDVMKDE